jgi:hypothetical protein
MQIRCPQCRREFEFDPARSPARCPFADCGWTFGNPAGDNSRADDRPATDLNPPKGASLFRPEGPKPVPTGNRLPEKYHGQDYVTCPVCRARVPAEIKTCPVCGEPLLASHGDTRGIRAVFGFSGDITFTPRTLVFLIAVLVAGFLTFTWLITSRGKRGEPDSPALAGAVAAGKQDATVQGITFSQLKSEFLDSRNTDFQREVIRQKYTDQRVIWSGLVKTVASTAGGYEVDIVMDGEKSHSFVTLQVLDLGDKLKLAGELSRGKTVLFSGKIAAFDTGGPRDMYDYFRLVLKDGIVLK